MLRANCHACKAACCRANTMLSLSRDEAGFMERGGNRLLAVVEPADYDREDAIYPAGLQFDPDNPNRVTILVEQGREYEPLAAGLGRYVLLDDCEYLEPNEHGIPMCGVYDQRPQACRDFEMGGDKCLVMRRIQGIDT